MDELETLRYPVGRVSRRTAPLNRATRSAHIDTIEQTPAKVRSLVNGRSDARLATPYRPGGGTVRKVVHHVPDSHMNAYIRMKFAITEEAPAVKAYDEARWAELPEAKTGPIEMSVALLEALHRRWVAFLRALPPADFRRSFLHPEWKTVTIEESIVMYSWHCRHHAAHIEIALGRAESAESRARSL